MKYITPSEEAIQLYKEFLTPTLDQYSEMTHDERIFFVDTLMKHKPKKILEVGVSAGGSATLILETVKRISPNSQLHSIDLSEYWWLGTGEKVGFIIDDYFPYLKTNWHLYTGNYAATFMDQIGGEIDCCLIDTAHVIPGEILDFLMVFPYLKKNALILFHDTSLHTNLYRETFVTCGLLSILKGKKTSPNRQASLNMSKDSVYKTSTLFPNLATIELHEDTKDHLFDIFNFLTFPWVYPISQKDTDFLSSYFLRFYDSFLVDMFIKTRNYYQENLKNFYKKKFTEVYRSIKFYILSHITFGKMRQHYHKEYRKYIKI